MRAQTYADKCVFFMNNHHFLNLSEIESLPVLGYEAPEIDTIFQSITYNKQGQANGKTLGFKYFDTVNYPKQMPVEFSERSGTESYTLLWPELNKRDFPPGRWLIKGLVPVQGITILASPSGEKKTWIAMEMAKCIATGQNFLGTSELKTEKAKVLYVDQEMSQAEFQRRGRQLSFPQNLENLWILNVNDLNLNDAAAFEKLSEHIKKNSIGFVVIDTLRAVAGGLKEEKAEEVRAFFNRFRELKSLDVSILILDHCRKPQRFEGKAPKKEQLFSSQDKVACAEVLLMIKSDAGSDDIAVHQVKNRMSKEMVPFKINMHDNKPPGQTPTTLLTYGGIFEEKAYKLDEAKDLIMEILSDGSKNTNEIIDAGKIQEIGEKNIREATRALVKNKHIEMKRGHPNIYSLPSSNKQTSAELVKELFGN
jgi:hypothetical protein